MTLYHLISEQVWQNLIPVLALRPQRIVHVRSASNRWRSIARRMERAVADAIPDWSPEWMDAPLAEEFPTIAQMRVHMEGCHSRWPASTVNFTGGSKLGAIGAHQFAAEQNISSFYFDTRFHALFDGETSSLPDISGLAKAVSTIGVRMALIAHGLDSKHLRSTSPIPRWLAFSQTAAQIRAQSGVAINRWLEDCRCNWSLDRNGNIDWISASIRALPPGKQPAALDYADAAVAAGLLRADSSGRLFLIQPAHTHFQLLEGGWWELACMAQLSARPDFADVLWSVQSDGNDSDGETDLIAFNSKELRLEFFSCKAGRINNPLEHVESLRNRATRLGGPYAAAHLLVFHFQHPRQQEAYQRHCQRHKVQLWSGANLQLIKN